MKLSTRPKRIFIGMSGGVDSSVAALLLCQEGYEVVGVTLDLGNDDAAEAAAKVCRELGIRHLVRDRHELFQQTVVNSFVHDYASGLTPSPCIVCNPQIKFASLLELCEEADDFIATGHYVNRHWDDEAQRYYLTCGCEAKDQSYFLCLLEQSQIARCLFPLGKLEKPVVRELARIHGLSPAEKRDSFDICFIQGGDYRQFLREQGLSDRPGLMVDAEGRTVGQHRGLSNYTIGQRRGLETALGYPAYVLALDAAANRLVVGPRDYLYRTSAFLDDCVFSALEMETVKNTDPPFSCLVRVRHKAALVSACLTFAPERGNASFRVDFLSPVWGLTPGQFSAFYRAEGESFRLLGGGRLSL